MVDVIAREALARLLSRGGDALLPPNDDLPNETIASQSGGQSRIRSRGAALWLGSSVPSNPDSNASRPSQLTCSEVPGKMTGRCQSTSIAFE